MFLLLFFVLLIQFFTYWIFEPITKILTHTVELRFLPFFLILLFIFFFSKEKIDQT